MSLSVKEKEWKGPKVDEDPTPKAKAAAVVDDFSDDVPF